MSIEAMKQAAQDAAEAIDWLLKNIRLDAPQLSGKAMGNAEKCASALRAALSQQPATRLPEDVVIGHVTLCKGSNISLLIEYAKRLNADVERLEAQQPATPEPVASRNPFASRCYMMSESHLSGHRLIVGFEKLGDAQDAHEWVARQGRGDFTHPAPSVPADVVRVPLQVLKDASEALGNFVSDHGWGDADMQAMDNLDAYIARHEANRAAMLAAKDAK